MTPRSATKVPLFGGAIVTWNGVVGMVLAVAASVAGGHQFHYRVESYPFRTPTRLLVPAGAVGRGGGTAAPVSERMGAAIATVGRGFMIMLLSCRRAVAQPRRPC